MGSLRLEQFTKLFQCKTGIANNSCHCISIHGIISGNREYATPIGHHNMFALANDSKARFLERPHGMEVRYAG